MKRANTFIFVMAVGISIALMLHSCAKSEININNPDYSIYGKLTFPDGTTGIANITVTITGNDISKSDNTDAFGSYQFSDLPTGNYEINISQTTELTGLKTTISIAQSDKEFNIMLGQRYFDYFDSYFFDNKLFGFKLDPVTMYIGTNYHLIEYVFIEAYGGHREYNIYKVPPVNWNDLTKDPWKPEWYYDGELLQYVAREHLSYDNGLKLTGSELIYFLQAATSNGVIFGYSINIDYSTLYVKYSFN